MSGTSMMCYWCKGTGVLTSDEECPCVNLECGCKNCKDK